MPAPASSAGPPPIAARLWRALSALPPSDERLRALDRALVLLADHELATSTLAVRIATSVRAPLASVVLAGLGTLDGALHAGAAATVHRALHDPTGRELDAVVASQLAYGRAVHSRVDPRTLLLLESADQVADTNERAVVDAARAALASVPVPTADFGLGAFCYAARMRPDAATAIFAVARSAGWIAHAQEESEERPMRFRGRAVPRQTA